MIHVQIFRKKVKVARLQITECDTIDHLLYWVRLGLVQYPDAIAIFDYAGSTYRVEWVGCNNFSHEDA